MIVAPRDLAKKIECSIPKFRLPCCVFKGICRGVASGCYLHELTPLAQKNVSMVYILFKNYKYRYKYPYHINISNILCEMFNIEQKFIFAYSGSKTTFRNTILKINKILKEKL